MKEPMPGTGDARPEAGAETGSETDPGGEPIAPLGIARTPTGDARVDARLDRLADADHLAASGHLEVYEDVHRGLRDTLTELDRRPPSPPAPNPSIPTSYDTRS
ncbi:hypothetical protein [Streptomyces sp. SAJ15]|uniref:hypothetical protein n=1 Tax=Streptomyces sp. SAJ15 TaxID=2011095 RepID=UPI0011866D37|nr:hypothetical protein [Streptomyces sp. SAJ15]TVL90637.1 hypothetical protein CD790_22110 [Streptomyces sp. SAJ15]